MTTYCPTPLVEVSVVKVSVPPSGVAASLPTNLIADLARLDSRRYTLVAGVNVTTNGARSDGDARGGGTENSRC